MPGKNIDLSVCVVGDSQANPESLIRKFVDSADLEKESPSIANRNIPFGDNNVNMSFMPIDEAQVDSDFVPDENVILFCYNAHEKSSYIAAIECFRRVREKYKGMIAFVGCAAEGVQLDASISGLSEGLNLALKEAFPDTYLGNYFSRNKNSSCGVAQLILNFIADKALKLKPSEPVLKPVLKREPIKHKPNIPIDALVLGQGGVGKRSVLNKIIESDDQGYIDALGHFHQLLAFPEYDVHLELTPAVSFDKAGAKKYHVALFCFDLTDITSAESLLDDIKSLMEFNPDITFAVLGNKRDLLSKENYKKTDKERDANMNAIQNTMGGLMQCLSELYPYAFMGIYLNSTQDSRHDHATRLVKLLSQKYLDKKENEMALADFFINEHSVNFNNATLFSRTSISPEDNFQAIVRKASRPGTRSSLLFKKLGWFDEKGGLCETTPLPVELIRKTMDMAGVDYQRKKIKP